MTDDTTNNDGKQKPVNLLTSQQSFIQDDKSVVRKTDQAIPQAFLSELKRTREDSVRHNTGDYQSCLLYTSPSPRDRTRSRMPSSA